MSPILAYSIQPISITAQTETSSQVEQQYPKTKTCLHSTDEALYYNRSRVGGQTILL